MGFLLAYHRLCGLSLYLLFTSTCTVLLDGTRRHNFHTNNQRMTPSKTRGQTGPVGLHNVGLGGPKESHETVQATFTLVVPRWGDPQRPVPTAASIAAVSPGLARRPGVSGPSRQRVERNKRVSALLELMLCKNPFIPQRYSNCAEARSPRTVWRWLASSLRLSPHERAGLRCTAGGAALSAPVSFAMPGLSPDCVLHRKVRNERIVQEFLRR